MLKGNRIYLRLMEERDVPLRVQWINDPEVRETLNFDYPISTVGTRLWLNKVALDNSRKDFIVCLLDNDDAIGYAGFLNIDYKTSKAEVYTGIGEKKWWGKGIATEIKQIQINYGFNELGLNKLYTYIWSENKKMIHINEKFGFKIEGVLRQDKFSHGALRDRVYMGLLKEDYVCFKVTGNNK